MAFQASSNAKIWLVGVPLFALRVFLYYARAFEFFGWNRLLKQSRILFARFLVFKSLSGTTRGGI